MVCRYHADLLQTKDTWYCIHKVSSHIEQLVSGIVQRLSCNMEKSLQPRMADVSFVGENVGSEAMCKKER